MKLISVTAAWIAGLLIGIEADVYLPTLILFSAAAVGFLILSQIRTFYLWPSLAVLVLLMGIIRAEVSSNIEAPVGSGSAQTVAVRGTVASDPEMAGRGVEFRFSIDAVDTGNSLARVGSKILVFARPTSKLVEQRGSPFFRYGDRLELQGSIEEPTQFGDFDYPAYLATQGIHAVMGFPEVRLIGEGDGNPILEKVYDLRRNISEELDQALPEPQASLAQALLLGIRSRLPSEITDDFRATGTSHLLAVSGLHVGTVLILTLAASIWLIGRRRQLYLLIPLVVIWSYALLSGFATPVERAAIMGSVYLAALALGRPKSSLPALALAAAIMAGIEPQVLQQVSFQLSFTAIAGIAIVAESEVWSKWGLSGIGLESPGLRRNFARWLLMAAVASVAATVATLPLIAFNFHRIPTVGIPATILALPAVPVILATSAAAAVANAVHPVFGDFFGWLAWVPLELLIRIIDLFASVPGSVIAVPKFSGLLVWVYYGAIAGLLITPVGAGRILEPFRRFKANMLTNPDKIPGAQGRASSTSGLMLGTLLSLVFLNAVLWLQVVAGSDGRLHVYFLNVGQGDSTFVVTPEGNQVLIDGGPDQLTAIRAIGDKIPFWDHSLDLMVLTHPDQDHFRGLIEVADRYDVSLLLESGAGSENPLYLDWERIVNRTRTPNVQALEGQLIKLGKATLLEVLNPGNRPFLGTNSDTNNNSIVIRMNYGDVSFLLTADVEAEAENYLLEEELDIESTVLKVPHHGSKASTTLRFLHAANPAAAVISAGANNPHGHPHPEVVA